MPEGCEEGIVKGLYLFSEAKAKAKAKGKKTPRVQLLGSGTILREVIAAADLLREDWGVAADVWSAPSLNELKREGQDCERWNLLHPEAEPRVPYVTQCLQGRAGPVVAATDYMKNYADQIRAYVPAPYRVLGTDGFGRSDTRANLRLHFEVNAPYIAVAALKSLAEEGAVEPARVSEAIARYGIDVNKPNPLHA
jgi:pyruvate dehydrogenase E1 component